MKNPFRSIRIFWGETILELKKATWPTLRELRESTVVVLVAVVLLGAFIGILFSKSLTSLLIGFAVDLRSYVRNYPVQCRMVCLADSFQ